MLAKQAVSWSFIYDYFNRGDRGHQSGSHKQAVWGRFIIFYIGEPGSLIGFTQAKWGGL